MVDNYESAKVISLDYESLNKKRLFFIELWEDEMEISTGFPIKESDISQIEKSTSTFETSANFDFMGRNIGGFVVGGFILFIMFFSTCFKSSNYSWDNSNSAYSNDTSKVERSNNNYYRGRSSRSRGK